MVPRDHCHVDPRHHVFVRDFFDSLFLAFHHVAFQVASIITTTGFATVDFNLWPTIPKTILVLLMFIGACAGSTGGGIKVSRVVLLFRSLTKELSQSLHPNQIRKIHFEDARWIMWSSAP